MKQLFMAMIFIATATTMSFAQGVKATYIERTKSTQSFEELDPVIRAAVETQMKQQDKTMNLYYYQGESVYTIGEDAAGTNGQTENSNTGINIQINHIGGNSLVYKDRENGEMISQEAILDRQFLVTEEMSPMQWKIETEEKTIAGFRCKKASMETGWVAWYCPEIPIADGPGIFYGLPGLILEIDSPAKTITLQEIDFAYDTTGKIKKPGSGKKISREEFNKTLKKKMEEMGVPEQGSGTSIKIIRM